MEEEQQREIWWLDDTYNPEADWEKRPKKEGHRISISKIETLSPLYNAYLENPAGVKLLEVIQSERRKGEPEIEKVMKNVESSIYGTQIHQLQYITQIFKRCEAFGRKPDKDDFYTTFPFKSFEFHLSMERIVELMEDDASYSPAENFWRAWRLNGHDFKSKSKGIERILPSTIKQIWEGEEMENKILKDFRKYQRDMRMESINPEKILLVNEMRMITNIDFVDSNMQLISIPDEVRVPSNFPYSPIEIIDYKTGSQFRRPDEIESLQIFLTKIAVYGHVVRRFRDFSFGQGQWEAAHQKYKLPRIEKIALEKMSIANLHEEDLKLLGERIDDIIKFSYVNPATQRRMHMEVGSVSGYLDEIAYIKGLNEFCVKNKEIVKQLVKRKGGNFSLPSFPYEGFDKKGKGNLLIEDLQKTLF